MPSEQRVRIEVESRLPVWALLRQVDGQRIATRADFHAAVTTAYTNEWPARGRIGGSIEEVTMSVKPKPSVVVFVADVRRVSTFYRELASMEVLIEEEGYTVMEVEGLQLVVHRCAASRQSALRRSRCARTRTSNSACPLRVSLQRARWPPRMEGRSSLRSMSGRRADSAHATGTIRRAM